MSGRLMGAVLAHTFPDVKADPEHGLRRGVSGHTLKLVALGIANRANDDGRDGWPSFRELAECAQIHTDTVTKALTALQQLGYLLVVQRGDARRSTRYALIPAALERASQSRAGSARPSRAQRASQSRDQRASQSRAGSARPSRAQRASQSRDQRASQSRAARVPESRGTSLQTCTSENARGQSPPDESDAEGQSAVTALSEARAALARRSQQWGPAALLGRSER